MDEKSARQGQSIGDLFALFDVGENSWAGRQLINAGQLPIIVPTMQTGERRAHPHWPADLYVGKWYGDDVYTTNATIAQKYRAIVDASFRHQHNAQKK